MTPVDTVTLVKDQPYGSWTVTTLAQAWANKTVPNYGVMLDTAAGGDNYVSFHSREAAEQADRPTLKLTLACAAD